MLLAWRGCEVAGLVQVGEAGKGGSAVGQTVAVRGAEFAEEKVAESVEVAAASRALGAKAGVVVPFRACAERLAAPAPFSVEILS